MRKFWVLLRKELLELITPQILLPFAITILVFVFIGNVVGNESERMAGPSVTVIDMDESAASGAVIDALEQAEFEVTIAPRDTDLSAVPTWGPDKASLVVSIPRGFGDGIAAGTPQKLESYTFIRNMSFLATRDTGALAAVLEAVNESLSNAAIERGMPGSDPAAIKRPVGLTENVVLDGKTAQASAGQVLTVLGQQTTFIPIVLFLVIVFAAQMIATTIASEKENKTLETLLASPIGRGQLVTAKMVAAATIALLSAAAYMAGMRYYMNSLMGGLDATSGLPAGVMEKLGLTLGAGDYVMLGASLFAGILVALAAAVILGAFAENVRSVQSLITPLMVLIMIPYFLTLFVDLETAAPSIRWLVLAIPFAHPFLAALNIYVGDPMTSWAGTAYELVWFVGLSFIAARIFSSDRILTLKLGKARKSRRAR